MKSRRLLAAALSAAMVLGMSACSFTPPASKDEGGTGSYDEISSDHVSFSFGTTKEFGNDQVGWLTLPDTDYILLPQTDAADYIVQYDRLPCGSYLMDFFDVAQMKEQYHIEFDAKSGATMRYDAFKEEQTAGIITELSLTMDTVNGYTAYRVSFFDPEDNEYRFSWHMDSPDGKKVYYLAVYFQNTDEGRIFYDYYQSYRMPE